MSGDIRTMKLKIFTLDKKHLKEFSKMSDCCIPGFYGDRGTFSIGAVFGSDAESTLVGLAQFHLGLDEEHRCFGILDYIFVEEAYRRRGIGTKLVDAQNRILKQSGISKCVAEVSDGVAEIESFMKESEFLPTKEKNGKAYIRFLNR